jgi:hypothetical protein
MIKRLRPTKNAPSPAIAVAVAALFIVVALAVAACGGGGDSGGVASIDGSSQTETDAAAETSQDPQEAALAFARCMRRNGVDMPDPQNGELRLSVGPNDNPQKVEKAQKACEGLLEGARPQLTEDQQAAMQEGLLAFAKCMRERGIDMPDPQFGEGGIVTQRARAGSNFDPDDPKFQAAAKACQPILDEARREAGLPERAGGGPAFGRSGGGS